MARRFEFPRGRLLGHYGGGRVPLGQRVVRRDRRCLLLPSPAQRGVMRLIWTWRLEGRPWRWIGNELELRQARAEGREPLPLFKRYWTRTKLQRWFKAELRLQAEERASLLRWAEWHGLSIHEAAESISRMKPVKC